MTVVLVSSAVALGVVAWRSLSSASDARARAAAYRGESHALHQREAASAQQRTRMVAAAANADQSMRALLGAVDAGILADDRVVAVVNGAVALGNSGNSTGAIQRFKTDGESGLADLAQKVTALHAALTDAQRTASAFRRTIGP